VACFCAGLLFAWVPHYVTWPWCRDVDTFSTLALGWDLGTLPYRDILVFNFPGHIYLHWVLGKVFGWGRTVPFYALDAAGVVTLGIALAAWSRRMFGSVLAGLVSYVVFLSFYLGLEYELVAQRDWHATLLTALGLMAAEAWPGRSGRLTAAVCAALALTIRPHVVLFLPAMASAVIEGAQPRDSSLPKTTRALGEWAVALALCVAVAFAPMMLAGLVDDLARGVRVAAYGGRFSKATPSLMLAAFANQFNVRSTDAVVVSCLLLWRFGPRPQRGPGRTWLLALLGALVYRPLHPVQHDYLAHPLALIESVSLALPVAWLAATPGLSRTVRLLLIAPILFEAMPEVPRFCRPMDSLRAFGPLVRGEEPSIPPVGAHRFFRRNTTWSDRYPWSDYTATLGYLRHSITAQVPVANLLKYPPYPSLNGATGHPSPFRVESGICWMVVVDVDLDAEFAASLESSPQTVVVWVPDESEPRLELKRLTAVVQRYYVPEAKFGRIEVWRRGKRTGWDSNPR
jgi:hypothetical protein